MKPLTIEKHLRIHIGGRQVVAGLAAATAIIATFAILAVKSTRRIK
jgi:hypothetical protein